MDWASRIVNEVRRRQATPEHLLKLARRLRPVPCGFPMVRIGPKGDGGYLVPDDLAGIEACFSPGVGRTFAFEADLLARGIPSHLADASVPKPPDLPDGLTFDPVFLGARNADGLVTLDEWVRFRSFSAPGDLLLQMDIEGAEYEVLAAASQATLSRFRIIVLELHDLHHARRAAFLDRISRAFKRLHETHAIVHLHPNNCRAPRKWLGLRIHPVMEITMLRRDRVRRMTPVRTLPHPLDRSNIPGAREWALDENWLAQTGDRT